MKMSGSDIVCQEDKTKDWLLEEPVCTVCRENAKYSESICLSALITNKETFSGYFGNNSKDSESICSSASIKNKETVSGNYSKKSDSICSSTHNTHTQTYSGYSGHNFMTGDNSLTSAKNKNMQKDCGYPEDNSRDSNIGNATDITSESENENCQKVERQSKNY